MVLAFSIIPQLPPGREATQDCILPLMLRTVPDFKVAGHLLDYPESLVVYVIHARQMRLARALGPFRRFNELARIVVER
jgi:hypothetical protein